MYMKTIRSCLLRMGINIRRCRVNVLRCRADILGTTVIQSMLHRLPQTPPPALSSPFISLPPLFSCPLPSLSPSLPLPTLPDWLVNHAGGSKTTEIGRAQVYTRNSLWMDHYSYLSFVPWLDRMSLTVTSLEQVCHIGMHWYLEVISLNSFLFGLFFGDV